MHTHILLINPLIPRREILFFFIVVIIDVYFNPLIPHREIQQYCTKNLSLHFCSITKNHLLSLFIASEILKIQELTTKTILIPVRIPYSFHVSFRFAPEWHLLSITTYYSHIASPLPFSMYLLY